MIAEGGRDYSDLPHLTKGDTDFREKFLSWDLGDITFTDIRAYLEEKDTIIIPMASLEQHGPHLPLYTDTITAIEMSRRELFCKYVKAVRHVSSTAQQSRSL